MGYYTDVDLPFYYALAETFAINDRYFCLGARPDVSEPCVLRRREPRSVT